MIKLVSSAERHIKPLLTLPGKSPKYHKKSSGPNTEPSGTPYLIIDFCSFIRIFSHVVTIFVFINMTYF